MNDIIEKALQAVELAKAGGAIKKGTNETTKALERGTAKLVVVADDVSPAEITMHIIPLAKEKNIPCVAVPKKEDLGAAAGLGIATVCVAITDSSEASSVIAEIVADKKSQNDKTAKDNDTAKAEPKAEEKETTVKEDAPDEKADDKTDAQKDKDDKATATSEEKSNEKDVDETKTQ